MKRVLSHSWKLAQIVCVAVVLLLGILAAWLGSNRGLSKERLRSAFAALQGRAPAPPPPERPDVAEEWRRFEESRARTDASHRRRDDELRRLQDMTAVELAQLEQERKRLGAARADADKARADAKREREEFEKKKIDQATEANLPIYEELKGQELAALMTGWDDKEIVRILRLLSPEKSAQVLRAMQAVGSPYRVADPKAPKDAPTRLDRIVRLMQS